MKRPIYTSGDDLKTADAEEDAEADAEAEAAVPKGVYWHLRDVASADVHRR